MAQEIVIAETEARNARRMAEALQQRGFDVVTASDASHALAVTRQERPEVVVITSQQLAASAGSRH